MVPGLLSLSSALAFRRGPYAFISSFCDAPRSDLIPDPSGTASGGLRAGLERGRTIMPGFC